MLKRIILTIRLAAGAALSQTPVADHHQHVFSQPMAEFQKITPISGSDVVKLLDEAGIQRAVLLSTAFSYGRPGREPQNEYEKVREENDWVASQAAMYPRRLIAFCSFNPLKDYALTELARCAKNPGTRRGLKLHFGNSDVQVANAEHLEKIKAVFREANRHGMTIVMHFRASFSKNRPYGPDEARALVDHLLPLMTKGTLQLAHLGSAGPGYNDDKIDAFMDALVGALGQNSRSKVRGRLWFDLTTVAHPSNSPERSAMVAKRIRQIGADRILYGTDAVLPGGSNLPPKASWAEFSKIGLTQDELKKIAANRAPYFR